MKKILIPLVVFIFLWVVAGFIMNKYPLFAQEDENENLWYARYPMMSTQDEEGYPMWIILHLDQDDLDAYYENLADQIILSGINDVSVEEGISILRDIRTEIVEDATFDNGYFSGGMMGLRSSTRSCHVNVDTDDSSYAWIYLHSDDETRTDFDQALVIELQSLNFETISQEDLIDVIRNIEHLMVDSYINNNE